MESTSSSSANKKLKYSNQAVQDIIEIDGDDAPVGVVILDEEIKEDNIGKATEMADDKNWNNQVKDALAQDALVPIAAADSDLMDGGPQTPLNDSEHGSEKSDVDDDDDVDDDSYYDSDDGVYAEGFSSYNDTLELQAQFDAADLPPGVEASFPWFAESAKSPVNPAGSSTSTASGSSSSSQEAEDEALKKYKSFKKFDMVEDFSDHHFVTEASKPNMGSKDWTKTIHHEWVLLEKNLPDTIFVRAYEERIDLLRAVIIGAAGTPYHDGLFFFDLKFPQDYPKVPPKVHYHSGGLRLNPNLYNCGKVCLSLLNTWHGKPCEQWAPGKSTILQALLSIQALVLNEKPYFNEPGYERTAGTNDGEDRAASYNESTFILSCKTMLYTLHKPPRNFEDLVVGHFRERAEAILEACKAYIKGDRVGGLVEGETRPVEEVENLNGRVFNKNLGTVIASLLPALIKNGAKDCERFIPLGDVMRTASVKL